MLSGYITLSELNYSDAFLTLKLLSWVRTLNKAT